MNKKNMDSRRKERSLSLSSKSRSRDRRAKLPMYNPIDDKLKMLNNKFMEIGKSRDTLSRPTSSQFSFNDNTFHDHEHKPTKGLKNRHEHKITKHMLQNSKAKDTPKTGSNPYGRNNYASIGSVSHHSGLGSLQLSKINTYSECGYSTVQRGKINSKMSVNSSSVFLKNFKDTLTASSKQQIIKTERAMWKKKTK